MIGDCEAGDFSGLGVESSPISECNKSQDVLGMLSIKPQLLIDLGQGLQPNTSHATDVEQCSEWWSSGKTWSRDTEGRERELREASDIAQRHRMIQDVFIIPMKL